MDDSAPHLKHSHWADNQFAAATAEGERMMREDPRAIAVRYDRAVGHLTVELANGCTFTFPPRQLQGMGEATDDELAEVELIGAGFGLHWETLDADFTVRGLLNGVFGTARWMAARGGSVTSPAKAAAARANGRKGGRPRKSASDTV